MDSLYNTIYIGNKPGSEEIYTHAQTILFQLQNTQFTYI